MGIWWIFFSSTQPVTSTTDRILATSPSTTRERASTVHGMKLVQPQTTSSVVLNTVNKD